MKKKMLSLFSCVCVFRCSCVQVSNSCLGTIFSGNWRNRTVKIKEHKKHNVFNLNGTGEGVLERGVFCLLCFWKGVNVKSSCVVLLLRKLNIKPPRVIFSQKNQEVIILSFVINS